MAINITPFTSNEIFKMQNFNTRIAQINNIKASDIPVSVNTKSRIINAENIDTALANLKNISYGIGTATNPPSFIPFNGFNIDNLNVYNNAYPTRITVNNMTKIKLTINGSGSTITGQNGMLQLGLDIHKNGVKIPYPIYNMSYVGSGQSFTSTFAGTLLLDVTDGDYFTFTPFINSRSITINVIVENAS